MVEEMRGPSPVVPCIAVAALGWIICGPTLVSILESFVVLCQIEVRTEGSATAFSILILLLLFLLLLTYLFSLFFPILGISSSAVTGQQPPNNPADVATDDFRIGFGTLLLVLLFLVLVHLF